VNAITSVENNNTIESFSINTDATSSQAPVAPLPVPPQTRKRPGKRLYVGLSLALLLIVGIGVIGYVLWGMQKTQGVLPTGTTRVGQAHFLNSQDTMGAFDEVQLTLHNLPNPPSGKSYYAWLATHDDSIEVVHWPLTVQNGMLTSPSFVYPPHHNLLTSLPYLFLITLQGGNTSVPSFNPDDDLYYAVIPQMRATTDNYSVIDHLNHLLTSDPGLEKLGLHYGLRYWLLANTQALVQEVNGANDARQHAQVLALRQHLVNILYYLRGTACAPLDLRGTPQGTPTTPDAAIAQQVKASLLECSQNTSISSLLVHTELHVRGIYQAPGATSTQTTLAPQIQVNLEQVTRWLEQLYQQDVLHLLTLSDSQLLQTSSQSFFDDMKTVSNEVYNGQTPASKTGLVQMSNDLKQLATFDIMPCPRSTGSVCTS
jgi:hypothetical protein